MKMYKSQLYCKSESAFINRGLETTEAVSSIAHVSIDILIGALALYKNEIPGLLICRLAYKIKVQQYVGSNK